MIFVFLGPNQVMASGTQYLQNLSSPHPSPMVAYRIASHLRGGSCDCGFGRGKDGKGLCSPNPCEKGYLPSSRMGQTKVHQGNFPALKKVTTVLLLHREDIPNPSFLAVRAWVHCRGHTSSGGNPSTSFRGQQERFYILELECQYDANLQTGAVLTH